MSSHSMEMARGERFAFGDNWRRFLTRLDEARIRGAEDSLRTMLAADSLRGMSFLDVGSGSGLSSLAARRLGAHVSSFDFDPQSVACTRELKRRFFEDDPDWKIEEGSVLDPEFVRSQGQFDVVYSWGVLHHTGAIWTGLDNISGSVKPGGLLFIAIYNDQGKRSVLWHRRKRLYNRLPSFSRIPYVLAIIAPGELKFLIRSTLRGRPGDFVRSWTEQRRRGMSRWRDTVDWIGGLPFEVAKPEQVFHFCRDRGFALQELTTCGPHHGCNEYVFRRQP